MDKKTFYHNQAQIDVCVATTNSESSLNITFPFSPSFLRGDRKPYKIHELCGAANDNFVTVDPEYAPKFIKALTHAVELCGGKPSAF
jgi:hypothetical protein